MEDSIRAREAGITIGSADTMDGGDISPARTAAIPHRVGRYIILRQLGQGGMGVVYSAYDEQLDRKVALKLLRQAEFAPADRRARLFREAQAMARLSHPNVVQVYEVGEEAGQVFIAMEFIEGTVLADWQNKSRTFEEILSVYLNAGRGLLAAHRAGLVHRGRDQIAISDGKNLLMAVENN